MKSVVVIPIFLESCQLYNSLVTGQLLFRLGQAVFGLSRERERYLFQVKTLYIFQSKFDIFLSDLWSNMVITDLLPEAP